MALQIRRGSDADRRSIVFDSGEIIWTTDNRQLFVGDGSNLGGKSILANSAGSGLLFNATTNQIDFNPLDVYRLTLNELLVMTPLTSEPADLIEGTIAIANRITWDPVSKGSGGSYPVYFDGSAWHAFY